MDTIKYFHQPTVSESLGNGWYLMKKYFLWLLLAVIVSAIVEGPMKFMQEGNDSISAGLVVLALIGLAFFLLVRPIISFGADMMFVQAAREQEPNIKWIVKGFKQNYLNIVLTHLLMVAIIAIGFVALIIPGIILACRLAFVPYLVMDKELDPIKAIEASWRMTDGYGWTIFALAIVSFFIFIGGILCFFVGIFPAMIWVSSSFASLYQSILIVKEQEAPTTIYRE
ncbi:MAG: hypothetical protein PF541_16895 [Prolixibacteraceae bacterium]|nr:hypothetical protein [Prolixibacteraceae bacterium]